MARKKYNDLEKVKLDKEKLSSALEIFKYMTPYAGYWISGLILLVLGSLLFMLIMGIPGEMVNVATGDPKFEHGLSIQKLGLILFALLFVQGFFSYLRVVFFAIVSEKAMADLRKDLYDSIISQSISFYEKRRVGELTSRITADVEQLQSAFSITLAEFLRQVVILVSGLIIISFWTPKLSLIMLATFPVIVVAAMFFGRYIRKLSKKRQDQLAETNTIVEETLQSFQVVKSFANELYESIRYGKSVDEIVKISLSFARIRGLFFSFIVTVLFGGIFFILYRGALMVEAGTMESGDLFSFIIYTGIIGGAIASFGSLYTTLVSAIGATERVKELLSTKGEIDMRKRDKESDVLELTGDIIYKNVHFSYPTRTELEILKGINLEIKQGQKIALVGQSGSGKSTIVSLLMNFYQLDSGQISIDGNPINDYDLTSLRKSIGIVPQEVILFGGTIKENILYGNPDATEDVLLSAAERSNCLEFINSFPDGFETVVGERGIKLSGGQRQRVAIARAILKDPDILILDEATSSLDAESERLVQDALDKLMVNRTSIIIAHRLSTIKEVDQIYVLDNGKIIERGTHDELTSIDDGAYNHLAKLQFQS